MRLKLEKINFIAIKVLFFLEDVDIEKVLVTKRISTDEKCISALLVTYIMIQS